MDERARIRGQLLLAHTSTCSGLQSLFSAQRDFEDFDLGAASADDAAEALEKAASHLRIAAATARMVHERERLK